MQNTKEHIAQLVIANGVNSGSVDFTPPNGRVIGCAVYHNTIDNLGFVRAVVKDNAGTEISKLQAIENYRSRETGYIQGLKPLNIVTAGRTFTFEVIATSNFRAEFQAELIFVYEPENC